MVSFQELLKATDGFASANLIGEGCFGRVYRGILDQNQERNVIAVKVMNLLEQGGSKSFLKECKTLRNVRHRNLVRIISACSGIDFQGNPFKALMYEFMPNGSLEGWLHATKEANTIEHGEPKILNFPQRLNIAIDVASALDYLHHHCEVPVVHCDLKPSNILLDHDMVAHVGDFGLARFSPKSINNSCGNSTSTLGLKGTVSYAAPVKLIYLLIITLSQSGIEAGKLMLLILKCKSFITICWAARFKLVIIPIFGQSMALEQWQQQARTCTALEYTCRKCSQLEITKKRMRVAAEIQGEQTWKKPKRKST
ncbi:probable LRR receptor-like serine/threonine-protein kinase At3g47570 isoform X2 [Durio zibethinus]|uniref:Probable LRR receptor-like serine/threonine-protein kinase At3g47570 isoform X2 n=1 Tax=Durio zibethinus TaxID=66656 RepID=A0A6P5XVU7_DURZI|nr:probable LRR receptor-like serine/threonine-protein kinase At3g47570 isoform X2 [Durio zibethinus]